MHTRIRRGSRGRIALRAALALGALLLWLPCSALRGRVAAARVWLRASVQAGHLWACTGRSFEEYT